MEVISKKDLQEAAKKVAIKVSRGVIKDLRIYTDPDFAKGRYAGDTVFVEERYDPVSIYTWMPAPKGKDPVTGGHFLESKKKVPEIIEIAVHEGLHGFFTKDPKRGHEAIKMLKDLNYGGEEFEGLIGLGVFYVLAKDELKKSASDLYSVAKFWID